jgi:hypothetical protein
MATKRGGVRSMGAARFGAGLGSLGGWSWISGRREREREKKGES